jgi:hypothetical protein
MVIVDSSVLIDFLAGRRNEQTDWLNLHLGFEPIGITSLILSEVLQGIRSDKRFAETVDALRRGQNFWQLRRIAFFDSRPHADRFPRPPGQPALRGDREAMLRRAWEAGVGAVLAIGIGEQAGGMDGALEVCRQFNGQPGVPEALRQRRRLSAQHAGDRRRPFWPKLDSLLAEPEVIACGEIGLDYYHEGAPHPVQREGLIRQLEIAASRKRPILIHCRPKNELRTPGTISLRFWRRTGGPPGWAA